MPFHSGGGLGIRHATTARIKLQTESSGSDVGSGFEFATGGQAAIVNRDSRNLVVYGHSNLEHMRFTYTGGQTRIGMFTSADPGFHTGNGLCIGGQTTTTRVRIATSNTGTGASDGLEIVYSPSNGAFIYNNESENLHIGTGGTSTVLGLKNGATADLLALDGNKISGSITSTGSFGSFNNDFIPSADNTHDLGSSDNRWANIHSADLHLSNENTNGNEVDGTTGNWTIQEGEDDLYLLNRKNGKKYKFKLEEVT